MISEKDTTSECPKTREEYGYALNGELKDLLGYVVREAKSGKDTDEGGCGYVSFLLLHLVPYIKSGQQRE